MKKIIAALIAILTLSACKASPTVTAETTTTAETTITETTTTAETTTVETTTTAAETVDVLADTIITIGGEIDVLTIAPITVLIDDTMPLPFGENPSDGDAYDGFYMPGEAKFNGVPSSLSRLTDSEKTVAWFESFEVTKNPPDSLLGYPNIYSFIKEFGLTDEQVLEAMPGSDNPQLLSSDEMKTLVSGDLETVTAEFASDYAIVINDHIYSPSWVYTHTTDAYAIAGITPEKLAEKKSVYKDLPFTDEARAAFEAKIDSYN
jgi:hypothetical protein